RLRRPYVEERLLMLAGDPDVLTAVRESRISMAVAKELNKVKDRGLRLSFLDAAQAGGASARLVCKWRCDAESIPMAEAPPVGDGTNQYTGQPAPVTTMRCVCCDSTEEPWNLEFFYVHKRCRGMFLDKFLARIKGEIGAGEGKAE